MGTRLYPKTENSEILEALYGAKPGTHKAYLDIQIHERTEKADLQAAYEAALSVGADVRPIQNLYAATDDMFYHMTVATPDLAYISDFLVFGWRKLKGDVFRYLQNVGHTGTCGETTDQEEMAEILSLQGVDLPKGITLNDLGGLAWG
jgi:hypothetical protein